jgi:chromosome segregation ATPase
MTQDNADLNGTLKAIEAKLETLEFQRHQIQQQIDVKRAQIEGFRNTISSLQSLAQLPEASAAAPVEAPAAAPVAEAPKAKGKGKKA